MSSNLSRGTQSSIDGTAITDGKIRFAIDTGRLFIDTTKERIEITNVVFGLTYSAITSLTAPLQKLYLSSDTHQILNYDAKNEKWVDYGKTIVDKAIKDQLGQDIDATYIKNIKYNASSNIIITFGNGTELEISTPIGALEDRIKTLEDQVEDLLNRVTKIENTIEIKEETE